jgi:elongation factor G
MEPQNNGATEVLAFVPLANMFGYATDLRSRSQGRALYSMEPAHFSPVPKSIQDEIVNTRAKNN